MFNELIDFIRYEIPSLNETPENILYIYIKQIIALLIEHTNTDNKKNLYEYYGEEIINYYIIKLLQYKENTKDIVGYKAGSTGNTSFTLKDEALKEELKNLTPLIKYY